MPKRKRKEEEESKEGVKYKGVQKRGEKFQARITIDGKNHNHGTFDTPKEAAQAYDRAAIQAGRPTSKLNFLDQVPKNYKPKNNGLRSTNTTGFTGVCKNGNRFKAQIDIGVKRHHLGMFGTTKEAAIAFDLAAIQAKRPKSDLNFPDMIHVKKEIPRIKKRKLVKCTNTTGFNGVSKKRKKFVAKITIDGKKKHLGTFHPSSISKRFWTKRSLATTRHRKPSHHPSVRDSINSPGLSMWTLHSNWSVRAVNSPRSSST